MEALLQRTDLAPPTSAEVSSTSRRELPVRALTGAMFAWLSLIFVVCYLILPTVLAVTGVTSGVLAAAPFSLPAFAMASLVAIVGAALARPRLQLSLRRPRDPVLSATVGGLGVWAVVHNTSTFLQPFAAMSPTELFSFLSMNVLEMGMLRMMFASFTQRKAVALALGGGFQLLVLGLVLTLMSLAAV
ncbi:MAG: hypothetical protein R3F59_15515 [Myxococcota bacterium]